MNTRTGSFRSTLKFGVNTLTNRQSSLALGLASTPVVVIWAQVGPNCLACQSCEKAGNGSGGCQRSGPTGGTA